MPNTIERRFLHELRADSQGDELSLVGYAAMFNSQSEDLGGFRETVLPGAFARSLREGGDVKCLFNHNPDAVLGRTKNGTLQINEDAKGLQFRCVLPPTQTARDLYASVKRGDIDSCSFAFIPKEQSWEDVRSENGDLYASRKLMDVDLLDVSAVTNPAYASTSLSARALFPDGESVEMRSAINALVSKRAATGTTSIPLPYAISLPSPFDSDMKQNWWDAFMAAYAVAVHVEKKKGEAAIACATAAANLACQPQAEVTPEVAGQGKNPTAIKGDIVPTDADRALALEAEERKKSNAADVSNPDSDNYNPDDPNYDESMDYSSNEYEGDDADMRKAKAKAKADATAGNTEHPDGGADGGEAGSVQVDRDLGTVGEDGTRAKTRTIGDKVLHASDYAWVGDPNDPKSWKLPVDEAGRTQSALGRFIQTKGIPPERSLDVWKTIVSACKKFGIKVSEEDSLRAAIPHDVAVAILNEVEWDAAAQTLAAMDRVRMLQIEIDLQS